MLKLVVGLQCSGGSGCVLKTDGIDKKQCNNYPSALAVAEQGCFLVVSVQNLVFSYPEGVEKVCNKNTLAGNFDFCECLN